MDLFAALGYTAPMRRIYLDNASTSFPKAPGVLEAMSSYLSQNASNPGRGSYNHALQAMELVIACRSKLSTLFGCTDSRNVVFSLNVTTALNTLMAGLLTREDHVLVSGVEHNAVMRALVLHRIPYSVIPCDKDGRIIVEAMPELVGARTKALFLTSASNVTGTIQPIREAGEAAHQLGLWTCIDTAQGTPTVDCRLEEGVIDAIAFTGHKGLAGPQGVGGLVLSSNLANCVTPSVGGGTGSRSESFAMPDLMPDRLEAGTQNIVGIAGLSAALDFLNTQGMMDRTSCSQLLSYFLSDSRITVIGPATMEERTSVISITVEDFDLAELAYRLDAEYGIQTRYGLHCAPLAHTTLGTLQTGTIRFSCGYATTTEEIEYTIQAMKELLYR